MCKKLMFLISLVLLLGSVALATDYQWTNDYPWSYLYISPWNWDPIPPYGGPGAGGGCEDMAIIEIVPDPIVFDTDIRVNNMRVRTNNYDHDLYFVYDANVYVCDRFDVRDDPCRAYLHMSGNALLSVGSFRCHGDDGDVVINMTENAQILCRNDLRFGDEDNDYFELNMTDNAYLWTECDDDRMRQNQGEYHIDISGNAILEPCRIRARGRTDDVHNTFTVRENGQVICYDDYFRFAGGSSDLTVNVLDNGVVDADGYIGFGEDNDFEGDAVLNMSGQLMITGDDFRFNMDDEGTGFTTVNLTSGVIDCEGIDYDMDNWVVNICGDGVWVVDGDRVDKTIDEALNWDQTGTSSQPREGGHWIACPQEDCFGRISPRGDLMVEYDTVEYPGRTKIWVEVIGGQAWAPMPRDGETGVPPIAELCWCPGESPCPEPLNFHIFLSDDEQEVADGNLHAWKGVQTDNCYTTEPLCLGKTYYWRVESVFDCCYYPGKVWQFTVVESECIDDMEAYDPVSNPIWEAWLDGCGDQNGVGGNGTGSCVYTDTEIVHSGDKSMLYYYDCSGQDMSGDERDCNYAIATRDLGGLDISSNCAEAIELWFYGDPGNDATALEVMFMVLKDGSNNSAMVTYGSTPPEALADMQVAEWQQWDVAYTSLGAVDTTDIASISVGFGDITNCHREKGGYGVMRIDDICVFPCRCVPKYTPDIVDLNDDCVTDWLDMKLVADNWLEDERCNQ